MNYTFPKDFIWGVGGSAFQTEGAMLEDGKTMNIREAGFFAKDPREPFSDDRAPEVCCDFYHRYPEDLKMMSQLGIKMFRFSIAWSRIIPSKDAEPNQKAIDYYNKVIDCMIQNGITPFMDLFHSDLPLWVAEAGGIADPQFVSWYARYVEVCFRAFGDRVKYWCTVNEPMLTVYAAYQRGRLFPYIKDEALAFKATHHMILAHFEAVALLRNLWPDAKIGVVNNLSEGYCHSFLPEDIRAAELRTVSAFLFLDPMTKGQYPSELMVRPRVRGNISEKYEQELKEKFLPMDFCGINYYCPKALKYKENTVFGAESVRTPYPKDGYGFSTYAPGLFDALMRMQDRYGDLPIFITENGYAQKREDLSDMSLAPFHEDKERQTYIREHLRECGRAIRAGVNLQGYFYWSYMDSWEVRAGFGVPMGLVGVNFDTLERQPRESFYYYQEIIKNNMID